MPHYCNQCESAIGRDEEASMVDGEILCLDCLESIEDEQKPDSNQEARS